MEVYIVWFINFNGDRELVDIYTMIDDAENYIARHSDGRSMEIETRELL